MIGRVMREIKNYFPYQSEGGTFTITANKIAATFGNTYLPGQYLYLMGTALNDGLVQVTAVDETGITVQETLQPETAVGAWLWILRPPRDFLEVVAAIEAYQASYAGKAGVASESIDDYSVTFKDGAGWAAAFKKELAPYRCIFNEMEALRDADIRLLRPGYTIH